MDSFATIILSAGKGKRMKSDKPKVLHKVLGKTLLEYVYDASKFKNNKTICVVSRDFQSKIEKVLPSSTLYCIQKEQKGTADAVKAALPLIRKNNIKNVLILAGDMSLIRHSTINKLINLHKKKNNKLTVLTGFNENPKNYGRIIRDAFHNIKAIVEEKDLKTDQKSINEINTGVYVFDAKLLESCLKKIKPNNAQKEYYLTDTLEIAINMDKKIVGSYCIGCSDECYGVNTREDLARAIKILKLRKIKFLMDSGVTIEDPDSTFIDEIVKIGRDTVIHPFCVISGKVEIGKNCEIGPFAHIREKVKLKDNSCIGNFVEVKKSILGNKSKAKHLTYLGNAIVGNNVNIGAGTITANYDGVNKHNSYIGNGCKIGSNTVLVAPNKLKQNITTGAGTIIPANRKIPSNSLIYGNPAKIAKTNLTINKR